LTVLQTKNWKNRVIFVQQNSKIHESMLSVIKRIKFKMATLTYHSVAFGQPT